MAKRKKEQPTHFTKTLCELMEEKNMTVRKAAEIAGVGTSTINSWRSGAHPEDFLAVKKLAHALGTTLSFLLTGESDSKADGQTTPIAEVFDNGGMFFDGYARIRIERLVPRFKKNNDE
jgi:transcriptional regulator with XRE-family HTH domain